MKWVTRERPRIDRLACPSFDAFLEKYRLEHVALARLAEIIRAADTDTLERSAQAPGLPAISLGPGANIIPGEMGG